MQKCTRVEKRYEKESVIIFDEVQLLPKARQAIKYLVADGRYKYIETGALLSIKKNTKDILIPSGEHKISMYPMDFEEFLWAIGDEISADTIRMLLQKKKPAGNVMHRNLMRIFRLYMLIGGMPQAIETYLEQNNLQTVDETKREIVDLYEEDFTKIDGTGLAGDIFDAIPASLSGNASRYVLSNAREGIRSEQVRELFKDKKYTENVIYNKLLLDKLDSKLGYVYENVVAQMLIAKGNNLFYYTMESETSNHLYEIDFLTSVGDKICPIEVKSGNYRGHKSLDVFCDKFSSRVRDKYVVHTKDYKWENGIHYLLVYMVPFL